MKLFKRFFLLKSLGAAAFSIALLAFNSCAEMTSAPPPTMVATASKTLYAPTFPEKTPNAGESLSYGERYYTVSQGSKRKISLSWNPVGIAKYYEIFAAQNINDTFLKVGETTKTEFDDSVGSGKTYYYKVRAVNTKNEYSEFSSIVKGTSLATPAISDIEINDSNATVFWYMGNVGVDTYAKNLVYEVHAKGDVEKIKTFKAWDETTGSLVEECTFENLSGNCEYRFQVFAYITSEQDNVEKSPEVTEKTLALYTPAAPEFTASQGESVNGIKLIITLPAKIQVQVAGKDNPEDYPLCFEVQRKRSGETAWQTVVPVLYYNGTTVKPSGDGSYDAYKEGNMVEWVDAVGASAASIARGAKYDYRIISHADENYTTIKSFSPNDVSLPAPSKESLANTAQGWAAARPTFRIKDLKRNINPSDQTKVDSVSLGFEASWNDMGKAADYKFAIEYERSYNDGASDKVETKWLIDSDLNIILNSPQEVSAITKVYDLKNNLDNSKGSYKYTLYVFPAKYSSPSQIKGNELDSVQADNIIGVDPSAVEPLKDLRAEGGWTDHVLLTWTVEDGVEYKIDWTKHDDTNPNPIDSGAITGDQLKDAQGKYTGRYEHQVEGGYTYKYHISANSSPDNTDGSIPQAKTLGKPALVFTANSYTDITISWKQVVAAEKYQVKLGGIGGFGNGVSFVVGADGVVSENASGLTINPGFEPDATYPARIFDPPTNTIKLTISKPYGYNDATISGTAVPLVVTAISEVDAQNQIKGQSPATKDVWTIGPAAIDLKATEAVTAENVESDKIKITWKKAQGQIAGYAIYRTRPKMTGNTKSDGTSFEYKDESIDCYYVNAEGTSINKPGASVSLENGTFTLTDTYAKAPETNPSQYQTNQQYLALGIPFTYTVLPMLKASDATDVENEAGIKPAGEAYKNLKAVQKIGYTLGYGLALEATKAEYGDKVVLTWELPQSAIDKHKNPTICYRKKNSDASVEWKKWDTLTDSSAREAIISARIDRTQALEYAVTYSADMNSSIVGGKDAAFVEYQRGLKNKSQESKVKDGELEPKCVGYMFTMPQIEPTKQETSNESFTEKVQWFFYDKEGERAIGGKDITEYTLELKNLNCSDKYYKIYTYNANGAEQSTGNASWYDTTFTTQTTDKTVTVTVTPKFTDGDYTSSDFHDGLLKVQRDYKHYYRISAKRTNSQGEEITATSEDYAYRKIKDLECKRAIGLICADAMNQTGVPDATQLNVLCTTNLGNFTLIHRTAHVEWAVWNSDSGKCRIFTSGDYYHVFPRTPGAQSTPFTSSWNVRIVSDDIGGSCPGQKLEELPNTAITCTHETGLPSYTITDAWTVSGNCGGAGVFPYDFGKEHDKADSSLNTSFLTYKSFWWEVQP